MKDKYFRFILVTLQKDKAITMKKISVFIFFVLISFPLAGQSAKELYDKGYSLFNMRDYNGAIGYFTKAIEADPSIEQAWESRGISKFNLNDFSGALADLNKAMDLSEDKPSPSLCSSRGLVKISLKDYQGAVEDINLAIKQSGGREIRFFVIRASAKYFLGDYAGSISDCNAVINSETAPKGILPETYFWRGLAKVFSGGLADEGCQDLKKSAEAGYANANAAIKNYCLQVK